MPSSGRIPRPSVKRLSLYLRELESRAAAEPQTVSSRELGDALGITDAQVRKDLACFGQFGQPGVGYAYAELTAALRRILGTDRVWNSIVVGAGNIGRAVIKYPRLRTKGFEIIAAFDSDPAIIGTEIGGVRVQPLTELDSTVRTQAVAIALLAVPAPVAQATTDQLVAAGVRGILNFAPVRLAVPAHVSIVSADLTIELEQLAFRLSFSGPEGNGALA